MANKTVYPYGTNGSLPASIGIINDPFTGGADKAFSAEQGKIINEQLNFISPVDISSLTTEKAYIAPGTNTWSSGYDNWKCKFLSVSPGNTYVVKASANGSSYVAVLEDNSHTNGDTPNYAPGCSIVQISANAYYEFTIPEGGTYLYIAVLANNSDRTPAIVATVTSKFIKLQEEINAVNSQRLDISSLQELSGWIINVNNKWNNPGSGYSCVLVPITPGDEYIVVGNKTGGFFALLASDAKSSSSTPVWCDGYEGRVRILPGDSYSFTAPEDAAFVYLITTSSGNDYDCYLAVPKTIDEQFQEFGSISSGANDVELGAVANVANAIGNKLYPLTPNLDENGYVVPETLQELNCQRKAEQFSELEWTPISAVPKNTSSATTNKTFPANTKVTGLPYSSVKELDKYVGKDVSIHTFMTAVNNPYSLIYTENVSGNNSASAWGKTYHGVNCACYYGQVCSQFSAMCPGGPIDYATAFYPWLDRKFHGVVKVYDQSAQGVRVGDTFWKSTHCRMIYAVKKDSNGIVTHVQIAESTYTTTIINPAITAEAFNNEIKNDGCVIYRPLWLFRNIDYEPSPYVAIREETPQTVTYNNDICTFAGDKACFREGELIVINYNLKQVGAWTAMQLYKGSTLLDTITLDTSSHVVNLTSRNLTYGKYKARLTDGTNYSDYTEWEILQTDVAFSNNGRLTTVTPVSANGMPVAIKVCEQSGSARCMRELTEEEQSATSFKIDLISLNESQCEGLNHPIVGTSGLYLKVYFKGEFGLVTNEPLPIYFGY